MNSPVTSVPLRAAYLLLGGIPALVLSFFCIDFIPSTVATAFDVTAKDQAQALLGALLLIASLAGTASGWLVFFRVGTTTQHGRVVHTTCIASGVLAAVILGWDSLLHAPGGAAGPMAFSAGVVGLCLIGHMWSAARQGVPRD